MKVAESLPAEDPAPLKAKDAPEMARFSWEDAFLLEDQLEDDERLMRDAARNYAQTPFPTNFR